MARKKTVAAKSCILTVIVENPEGHRLPRQRVKIVSPSGVEVELRTDDEGEVSFPGIPPNSRWKVLVNGIDTGETAEIEDRDEEVEIEHDAETDSTDGEDEDEKDSDEQDLDAYDDEAEL